MVVARFALLGLAELIRNANPTWVTIAGSAGITSQFVCPPCDAVLNETLFDARARSVPQE